jgi:Protein of unknown function (DUF3343)
MARVVLVFASTHAAMAAEDALREAGIALQVIPLPAWVAADCGLALRLDRADACRAQEELLRREIPVRGIHEEPPEAGLLGDSLERH